MDEELCAFMNEFNAAFIMSKDLSTLVSFQIYILLLANSKKVLNSDAKGKIAPEKRLMVRQKRCLSKLLKN